MIGVFKIGNALWKNSEDSFTALNFYGHLLYISMELVFMIFITISST